MSPDFGQPHSPYRIVLALWVPLRKTPLKADRFGGVLGAKLSQQSRQDSSGCQSRCLG